MGLTRMIEEKEALDGRDEEMKVSEKHFITGNPMRGPFPEEYSVMVFANGCFWGSEKGVWRLPFEGVYTTAVGYSAGFTPNPTYEEVCSGRSGHTESVQVVFDQERISLVDILRWFWEAHDPTCGMGQGNDRGTQYRSGLYFFNEEQQAIFEKSREVYQAALTKAGKGQGKTITTEILSASDYKEIFYYAEDYHQQYLAKPGAHPYCSAQPQQVSLPPWEDWAPEELKEKYAPKLGEDFWAEHGPKPHCVIRSPNEPIVYPASKV